MSVNATVGKLAGAAQPARHRARSPPAALPSPPAAPPPAKPFLLTAPHLFLRLWPAPRLRDGSGAMESVCAFCLLFLLGWKSRGRGVPGLGQAASATGVSGARCPMAGSLWTQVRLGTAEGGSGVALHDRGWPNLFGSHRTGRFPSMGAPQFIRDGITGVYMPLPPQLVLQPGNRRGITVPLGTFLVPALCLAFARCIGGRCCRLVGAGGGQLPPSSADRWAGGCRTISSLKNPFHVHLGALLGTSASPTCHRLARFAPPGLTTANFQHMSAGAKWRGAQRGGHGARGKEEERQLKGRGSTTAASAGRRVLLPPARTSSCKLRRHAAAPASWEVLLMPKQSWAGERGGMMKVIRGRVRLQMWGPYPSLLLAFQGGVRRP